MAQQESENISEHVKLGVHMKMNRGELVGFNGCYGYKVQNEKIVIIEEEAEIVKYIFEKYSLGYGANAIAKMLMKQGIKSPKGSFTFSGRIRCGFCGSCYTRRTVTGKNYSKIPSWSCTSFAKKGKENCLHSKTIREEIIEEAFVDAYKLLISNFASGVEKILNIKEKSIDKENLHMEIERLKKRYQDTKFRKNRLIDLVLDKKISEKDFEQKMERYNTKLDKLGNKIEQLTLIIEDKRIVLKGLEKTK